MYDQREKAQRDYEWALSGARQEDREERIQFGEERGRKLAVIESVRMLEELLGELQSDAELLMAK